VAGFQDDLAGLIGNEAAAAPHTNTGRKERFLMQDIFRFLTRRLVLLLFTLFAVAVLIFTITRLLPGDVATMILGMSATPEDLATLRTQLGLDQPAVVQFMHWFADIAAGNFGMSMRFQRPVSEVLSEPLLRSAILGLAGAVIAVPLGLGLGLLCGLRKGSWIDKAVSSISIFAAAMPEFVTGGLFIVIFSSWLGWLPAFASSSDNQSISREISELIMPVMSLSLVILAYILRMARASVIETLNSEYVKAARMKGISQTRLITHHVLPISLGPTLQVIALSMGWMASGLVVVESLFGIPGIGRLLVFAIQNRDIPLLQAIALIVAATYAMANLLADLGQRLLDPRVVVQ
jgi:peptide/nickel transport system permease protein